MALVGSAVAICAVWFAADGQPQTVALAARTATLVLAIVVAVVGRLHTRVSGEAGGTLVGIAASLTAVSILAEVLRPVWEAAWLSLSGIALVLAAGWAAGALVGPTVDTTRSLTRDVTTAVGSLVAMWVLATSLATLGGLGSRSLIVASLVMSCAAWTAVTLIGVWQLRWQATPLRLWVTWMSGCLATSFGLHLLGHGGGRAWVMAAASMRLTALLLLTVGVASCLARAALRRREVLYETSVRHRTERRRRDESDRERDHEIRTALLAMEGATLTLERHHDRLDETQRETLTDAVRAGMQQLRSLTIASASTPTPRPLAEVLQERVVLARNRGVTVHLEDSPSRARVTPDPPAVAQALDNLLTNAKRHAGPEVEVRVTVEETQDRTQIELQDDGPGLPTDDLERIFDRGTRLDASRPGEGLGLAVARRSLRELGGDLRAVPSDEGARFRIDLPHAPAEATLVDEGEEGAEVVEMADDLTGGGTHLSPAARRRPIIQYHRQLGSRLWRRTRHESQVEGVVGDGRLEDEGDVGDLGEEHAQTVAEQQRSR